MFSRGIKREHKLSKWYGCVLRLCKVTSGKTGKLSFEFFFRNQCRMNIKDSRTTYVSFSNEFSVVWAVINALAKTLLGGHPFNTSTKFTLISYPLICSCMFTYQGERNFNFSEKFAFLLNGWSLSSVFSILNLFAWCFMKSLLGHQSRRWSCAGWT